MAAQPPDGAEGTARPIGLDRADLILWDETSLPRSGVLAHAHLTSDMLSVDVGSLHGDGYDLAIAVWRPAGHFRTRGVERRSSGAGLAAMVPSQLGLVDAPFPAGVWEGRHARAMTHLFGPRGAVDPNDPRRKSDRLRVEERVEPIDWASMRVPEFADYPGPISRIAQKVGLDPIALRGHRIRSAYPIFGTQLSLDISA